MTNFNTTAADPTVAAHILPFSLGKNAVMILNTIKSDFLINCFLDIHPQPYGKQCSIVFPQSKQYLISVFQTYDYSNVINLCGCAHI